MSEVSQEDTRTIDSKAEAPEAIKVASYYVDGAGIHAQPFTLHLILGATSPEGDFLPRVHLTMSPLFAAFLRDALTEAAAFYESASDREDRSK